MVWLIVFGAILLFVLIFIFIYFQSKGFVTEHYDFYSDRILRDFHFVFMSDLHEVQYGIKNCDLLEAIREAGPEYVLIGGDIITSYKMPDPDFDNVLDFIVELSKTNRVIFVPGNHERALFDIRDWDEIPQPSEKDAYDIDRINKLERCLNECKIPVLRNECLHLPDISVDIYGLDLDLKYYRRIVRRAPERDCLFKLLGKVDTSNYSIVLAHDPEHFKEYSEWGCDLVLSGHLHGGIIRIPGIGGLISPQLRIFPKYDSGVFGRATSKMLLTRGIGTHSVPIRIFNKAEICDVVIHKQ